MSKALSSDEALSSIFAFLLTAALVVAAKRKCRKPWGNEYSSYLSKKNVLKLREKHFMTSVSISYANTGGLMIVQGKGSRLMDETGQWYLDTRNNVAHVGHCHPRVAEAVTQQLRTVNTNTRYLHPNVCLLAERLSAKCPAPLEVVVFVNSGSEANDLALRLARAYTQSKNTIVIEGAYHGHTLSVLEVSPYKYKYGKEFPLTLQGAGRGPFKTPGHHIWQVPCPDFYRGPHRGADAGKQYAKYVKEACDYYKNKMRESVSAIIIEGGMSVGGVILPSDDFVIQSVAAVRDAGGIYIADEVQTGFGRLGSSFWAFECGNHGVVPDIVTVGKPFGNGMSLGAVIVTREIANVFDEMGIEYFNTFGGNPVAASAGLAVLDVIEQEALQKHALEIGEYLKQRFWGLQKRLIGDVRGNGLFLGIELVKDQDRTPATVETCFICSILKQKYHILTSIDGLHNNVLVVKPPMVFSKEDADFFVDSFEMALIELEAVGNEIYTMERTPT